jgi:general secretion pathway protein C
MRWLQLSALKNRFKKRTEQFRDFLKERVKKTPPSSRDGRGLKLPSFDTLRNNFTPQRLAFAGKALTIGLCAFFLSDVLVIFLNRSLPDTPPPRQSSSQSGAQKQSRFSDYETVVSRNLFNSKGLIPGENDPPPRQRVEPSHDGPPVRTALPLELVGVILVQNDSSRSLATLRDRSSQDVYPVRVHDEIPNRLRILEVLSRRVIFQNLSSGRREYVELPEDSATANKVVQTGGRGRGSAQGIKQVSENRVVVSRAEIDNQMSDINKILTQARAVPHFEDGVASGYKIFQIVPGSVYDQIGLENGDLLGSVNGQRVSDPSQAFNMLNSLSEMNEVELGITRNGQDTTLRIDIQ